MKDFTQIFESATEGIDQAYFLLAIDGAESVYRERVYCYELYHQMRLRWTQDCPYRLNGEVDKIGHPYFESTTAPKPDLLVHESGTGNNYAVIEIKTCNARPDGISKDLKTLSGFRNKLGYGRAIYLIYGPNAQEGYNKIREIGSQINDLAAIEIWGHSAPRVRACLLGNLPSL